jgi:hypothetical protein
VVSSWFNEEWPSKYKVSERPLDMRNYVILVLSKVVSNFWVQGKFGGGLFFVEKRTRACGEAVWSRNLFEWDIVFNNLLVLLNSFICGDGKDW